MRLFKVRTTEFHVFKDLCRDVVENCMRARLSESSRRVGKDLETQIANAI